MKDLSITTQSYVPPRITTTTLPGGTVGQPYNQTLQTTGGNYPLNWILAGGSLPAMLSLDEFGVISGTPTTAETANFTVAVKDYNHSETDTQSLSITISAAK